MGNMKLNANDGYPYTAGNLTDDVIDQLRNEAIDVDDSETADLCRRALIIRCSIAGIELRVQARIKIAAHLNAIVESEAP